MFFIIDMFQLLSHHQGNLQDNKESKQTVSM